MATILDGKALGAAILRKAAAQREQFGLAPTLAVFLVGDDTASALYVSLKEKACADAGVGFALTRLPADTTQAELSAALDAAAGDDAVDAMLLQLPLPAHFDADEAVRRIPPEKDADGFHPENVALLLAGTPRIVPPTIAAIIELTRSSGAVLRGKRALVVAKDGSVFTPPLMAMLSRDGITCGNAAPDAADLAARVRDADVLVTLAAQPGLITGDMISPGAIVIDVSTVRTADGRVVGDVKRAGVEPVAGWLSPVPGGVGPVTVAMLVHNVVALARARRGEDLA